ncbi:hypothetical protein FA15DRAFT_363627 [Coprinopsis marcescibilis]|uniref:Uncharacterized protein n=1 Tax=Coprinopsis marcescibilis TaxID=230819 RepID=A0A5C3LAF4_COPMA|nr:hypothetical protein FA15DRAFT_363627 [Coprinopsis marcescibilis]
MSSGGYSLLFPSAGVIGLRSGRCLWVEMDGYTGVDITVNSTFNLYLCAQLLFQLPSRLLRHLYPPLPGVVLLSCLSM